MKIDLTAAHPYKEWKILAQKEIKLSGGSKQYQITFAQDRELCDRVLLVVGGIIAIIATLGFILCSEKFRSCMAESFQKRVIREVHSDLSLDGHLWKKISSAPSTKMLHFAALTELPEHQKDITIRFLTKDDKFFPEGSSGAASFTTAEILLELGRSETELLRTAVFELTNFKQRKRFEEVDQKVVEKQIITADEYARECERIEYDGIKMHCEAVQRAIVSHDWHPEVDHYDWLLKTRWKTFEDFWREIKEGPHAQYYRKVFEKLAKQSQMAN